MFEKMKMQSADIVSENMAYIAQRWPECLTEAKDENGKLRQVIDFDRLRQVLSSDATGEGQERYQFTWPDKRHAIRLANTPTTDTLRPVREDETVPTGKDSNGEKYCSSGSVDFDNTQNLYIEGDNLDVLKLLRESYLGKVKMIYIDPPYNTGGDFVYKDNFIKRNSDYAEVSGAYDEEGNQIAEKFEKNVDSNGRFHTDWLNMIYPRLKVARDLLTEDGVIFISIDEHEVENLKKTVIEIFGDLNYIGTLIIQTATDNNPGQIKMEHEYILCACKNRSNLTNWEVKNESAKYIQEEYNRLKQIYNSDIASIQIDLRKFIRKNSTLLKGVTHYDNVDKQGVFHDGDIANTRFGGYEYDIIHPITGKVCKMPDKGYRFSEETMREMLASDDILFGADETTLPKPKIRLEDAKDRLRSVIYEDGRSSTKRFEKLMARDIFQNPKSDTIIARLIDFICDDNDLVLDFFSGSATTAEAIFNLGAKQKHLRYILVQIPENLDISIKTATNKAKKTIKNAIAFLDTIHKNHLITEIGKERIRRAGKKILEEQKAKQSKLFTNVNGGGAALHLTLASAC